MLQIGDKVKFLDEVGEGIIVAFTDKNTAVVELQSGLQINYSISQLVPSKEILKPVNKNDKPQKKEIIRGVKRIIIEKESNEEIKKSKKHQRKNTSKKEVDLHIEALIHNHKHLSNAQILEIQRQHFIKHLEEAILNNLSGIIFIHGVGNGVLKAEIRKILDSYPCVEYCDASYSKYGFGATEVTIR